MNLPKINSPVYDLILPIAKKKVRFRPFSVKEQKILLMSLETGEENFSEENVKQIVKNCCLDEELDIDNLSTIDIEYFFIHLRARSVGEIIESKYRCQNKLEDGNSCENLMEVSLNLLEIQLDKQDFDDIIKLTQTIGLKMRLPDYSMLKVNKEKSATKIAFDLIVSCIDYIYDENKVYHSKDSTKEELEQFVESLTIEQFKQVEKFFQTIPKLQKTIQTKCSKCGYQHSIIIEGLENFLG